MAVRFILGRSGTGKTRHCINAIIDALLQSDDTSPLILLVPEQATYQAERAILADGRIRGYSRLSVLSFNRLGFMLVGRHLALTQLSRCGQGMAVEAILGRHANELKVFGPSGRRPGLAKEFVRVLMELHRSGVHPEDMAELAASLGTHPATMLASQKFTEIDAVYRHYLQFIQGRFIDPDAELTQARKAAPQAQFLKDARLWIDGFAGFTQQEFSLLVDVLRTVRQAEIALCLDPDQLDPDGCTRDDLDQTSLFYPTECTYADLLEALGRSELELEAPLLLTKQHRFASPAIGLLEKHLSTGQTAQPTAGETPIRLLAGARRRDETEFAAAEIRRLAHTCGYRYRDIAVVTPDVAAYRHYIEASFSDCDIPFFLDAPRRLAEHPLAHMLLSAIRSAMDGFAGSDVFAFLKSGLGPLPPDDIDLLESYCVACGITSRDWTSAGPWRFSTKSDNCYDEAHIDALRNRAVEPLRTLASDLAGTSAALDAEAFVTALWKLMDTLQVRTKLAARHTDGQDHRPFFDRLVDLFDELVTVFAGIRMTAGECRDVFVSAVEEATLAIIPPRLDQVLVGTIERSRHPDLKAMFLLGCCQSDFPASLRRGGIMTDDDRLAADSIGLRLGDTVETQLAGRRYLAYIALTRASEKLYLSWPMMDEAGSPLSRSEFVDEIQALFPGVAIDFIRNEAASLTDVRGRNHLADALCTRLGHDAPADADPSGDLRALLTELRQAPELADVVRNVDKALGYDNAACVDPVVIGGALGSRLRSSVTRLESLASCPYQHFARYVLGLEPRDQFRFEPLDLGEFYHRVLDGLTKSLMAEGVQFASVSDDKLMEMLHKAVEQVLLSDSFLSRFRARSPHNAFIIDQAVESVEECAKGISRAAAAGSLQTIASELIFGHGGNLEPLVVPLGNGRSVSISGRIDRLDIAHRGNTTAAFVFDYKSSTRNLPWSSIYHGLDLQLPVYLLAIDGKKLPETGFLTPTGAFFFPVQTSLPRSVLDAADDQSQDKFRYKACGLFNGDYYDLLDRGAGQHSSFYNFSVTKGEGQYGRYSTSGAIRPGEFVRLLDFVRKKVKQLAESILGGCIDVQPIRKGGHSPCGTCDYRAVCRFDWQINDYRFLDGVGKTELLEAAGGQHD